MSAVLESSKLRPADLPAPSHAAIAVVRACSQDEIDNGDLELLVNRDPVLSAEVLRIANSAFFALPCPARSVSHAIGVLGHRALRNLVLCTAVRDALGGRPLPGVDVGAFWTDSLRRAVCARYLAEIASQDPEQAFTVGLLQDFGRLAMFTLRPELGEHWERLAGAGPEARVQFERELFGISHDRFGEALMVSWGLPLDITELVGAHHDEATAAAVPAQAVALCADWMSAVFTGADPGPVLDHCQVLLASHLGIEAEDSVACFERSAQGVSDAASALGFEVAHPPNFDEVMREANLRLAQENLSYQELTWRLERALHERDGYADELRRELDLAREVQRSLLPEGGHRVPGAFGINLAAKALSGDFYDYYRLKDGRVCFCLADVSGKGMNAAILMAKSSSLFRCLGKGLKDPSRLLAMLNREILETSVRGMFVTAIAGILDPRSGVVRLANAGHLPALWMGRDGSPRPYPSLAPPLGIVPEARFPSCELALEDGALYLFTDGLIEARSPGGERLELPGLIDFIRRQRRSPLEERARNLMEAVDAFAAGVDDDRTLLIVERA